MIQNIVNYVNGFMMCWGYVSVMCFIVMAIIYVNAPTEVINVEENDG